MALKTAFKTVKFYAARQGLQVRRVVSGCVLQLNLVDETSVQEMKKKTALNTLKGNVHFPQ